MPPGGAAEPGRRAGGRPPRQRGVLLPVVPLPVAVPGEVHRCTAQPLAVMLLLLIFIFPPRQVGQVFLYFQW